MVISQHIKLDGMLKLEKWLIFTSV